MTKKLLSVFAVLLLLTSTFAIADETQKKNTTEWIEDVPTDFGTDSYDEDGCFC